MLNNNFQYQRGQLITVSRDFLFAVKTRQPTDTFTDILKKITEADIINQLNTDDLKKAFWINLYNSCTQVVLRKDHHKYKNRGSFFGGKQIMIAGRKLSLDDIEHGILRRSKFKWSFGYLNKIFPSQFEKKNRVDALDCRIHFALNCGAISCPPIVVYDPEKLNEQLDLAAKTYLSTETEYDSVKNLINLPSIMGWFRADFGGKKKMITLIKNWGIIPKDKNPRIYFKKYNWKLFLENYKTESNE